MTLHILAIFTLTYAICMFTLAVILDMIMLARYAQPTDSSIRVILSLCITMLVIVVMFG